MPNMRTAMSLLAATLFTLPIVIADVQFVTPSGGSSATPGSIAWTWKDGGSSPSISDLTSYSIDLMAGGDTDATSMVVINLVPGGTPFSTITGGQGVVSAAQGGATENAYYLRIMSVAKEGGQLINFSPRFSISGMTGSFSPAVKQYLAANPITDTAARPAVNQVADAPAAGGASAPAPGDAQFAVPFNEQMGPTRYAPMMKQPPTAITKKDTAPLFPSSSVVIAKTWLPPAAEAGVVTTLTQSNTYHVSQMENTAAPVSNPNADMQKFLNRWKD